MKDLKLGSLPIILDYKWMYYHQIVKLFEWHFDVFGLIEKGLAVNYNEVDI